MKQRDDIRRLRLRDHTFGALNGNGIYRISTLYDMTLGEFLNLPAFGSQAISDVYVRMQSFAGRGALEKVLAAADAAEAKRLDQ